LKRFSRKILLKKAQSVLEQEGNAVLQLTRQISEVVMEIAEFMLNCKGHILVTGAGTSRAVSQRFAHLLACCGTPALFINAADALHGGAGAITSNDIVYVISKGGKSREINTFVEIAKSRGAKIVAHTENPNSPLAQLSDLLYHIVAPPAVDPYGMIATGSSLVNSAACDVLCVLLLTLRGYSKQAFGETHPEGAVGVKLAQEKK
jgi:D-arabinose 5-phosphate isomerase GutQ